MAEQVSILTRCTACGSDLEVTVGDVTLDLAHPDAPRFGVEHCGGMQWRPANPAICVALVEVGCRVIRPDSDAAVLAGWRNKLAQVVTVRDLFTS